MTDDIPSSGLRERIVGRDDERLIQKTISMLEDDLRLKITDPWRCPRADQYTVLMGRYRVRFRWHEPRGGDCRAG